MEPYIRDVLTAVSNTNVDFQNLILTKLGSNENFQNYDSRFAVAIAKMMTHRSMTLSESLEASILLKNINIESIKRISILSAAGLHSLSSQTTASNEELMDCLKHDRISSIPRQF